MCPSIYKNAAVLITANNKSDVDDCGSSLIYKEQHL